ncbi:MAG: hypothetical protein GX785_10970 [Armatimonadetes bacterium]|nr:hypothetical protein [Armatimonadota bacterium]
MYPVHAEKVVITEWVAEDPRAWERARRLAAAFGSPEAPVVSAEELAALARERAWREDAGVRTGAARTHPVPDVVLNAFTFDPAVLAARNEAYPELRVWGLTGGGAWSYRDSSVSRRTQGCVCQSAWEIHGAYGCLHACAYCHVGRVLNIMTNLESLAEHLEAFMAEHPELKLYKFDNQTDTICFEPEYGASRVMVELFARQRDRFLMLYTKSANVERLLELDHRGQTLISWSLSARTGASLIEKGTPSMEARIAAMRACQDAGYGVRARLSPICPVADWRREGTELIEALFASVKPDLLTLDVLGWMNARQMMAAMDLSLFERRFRDFVLEKAKETPGPHRKHLFPHAWRAEILRHYVSEIRRVSPTTPVSICMETVEMWDELGADLGMTPDHYACCCGPTSVPGHPLLRAQAA